MNEAEDDDQNGEQIQQRKKVKKIFVVSLSCAIADPRTMMIESFDAVVAIAAMCASVRANDFAGSTIFINFQIAQLIN
jgi:hypothetical protein